MRDGLADGQTDGQAGGRAEWNQYTPLTTSLCGIIMKFGMLSSILHWTSRSNKTIVVLNKVVCLYCPDFVVLAGIVSGLSHGHRWFTHTHENTYTDSHRQRQHPKTTTGLRKKLRNQRTETPKVLWLFFQIAPFHVHIGDCLSPRHLVTKQINMPRCNAGWRRPQWTLWNGTSDCSNSLVYNQIYISKYRKSGAVSFDVRIYLCDAFYKFFFHEKGIVTYVCLFATSTGSILL